MMTGVLRRSPMRTIWDLNVVIVVLIEHLFGAGANLAISSVMLVEFTHGFGGNLDRFHSRKTKFDLDQSILPNRHPFTPDFLKIPNTVHLLWSYISSRHLDTDFVRNPT